ncbi:MAG TPA: LysR family transcriptional regulator [Pseudonocardiaceae bacterium]|jgi:DNA-binding transcriptional LysR family regulator|nr:LysR family transcriptional regulator [Pseudonocardiaceae bacterium]
MLDVRRLRVLRSVVTSGSISAAAVNLGYTASAVSQQLGVLEREAGIRLLEKAGRGVRPTAAGRLLARHADEIMSRLAAAENDLADLRAGRTGRLRVHYFATAGAALVPPAVAAFTARYPGVRLDLRLHEPAYSADHAATGDADIQLVVLRPGHVDEQSAKVRLIHLLDDVYHVVLPNGHRLADRHTVELTDLADDPWVDNEFPPGVCRQIMLDAFAAAGFSPNFVVESDDYPTAQGFVAAGLGVTMVPGLGLGTVHSGVVVKQLANPRPVRSIYAAVADGVADQPAVLGMVDALRTAAAAV